METIALELTKFQASQASLQRSHDLFLAVIEGTTDAVFVKDITGRYLMMNGAGSQLIGRSAPSLLGRNDIEIFGRTEGARIRRMDSRILRVGKIVTFEQRMRLNGRTVFWHSTKGPLKDSAGNLIGVFGVSRDITERRRAEEEKVLLVEELKKAIQTRDDFLAVASHELQSPLAALRLRMETTLRSIRNVPRGDGAAPVPPWLVDRIETSNRQLQKVSRHVANLMDVARASAGKLELHLAPTDLSEVLKEIVFLHSEDDAHRGVELRLQSAGPLTGNWDRLRLEQVATNLLGNALKYGEGSPIEITLEAVDDGAQLQVKDGGIGIAVEHQPRIFERFERAPGASSFPGHGLGLWIVRAIVEAHGGKIRVESVQGKGSTFTVNLPRGR